MSAILTSVVVAELRQRFLEVKEDFLSPIKSYDNLVNNNAINFNEIGGLPSVVVDGTPPFTPVSRVDNGIPTALNRLDTIPTKVTDAELFALAYDKKSSVMTDHLTALQLQRVKMGLWNLCPASHSSNAPVIKTTGASVNGRKRMTLEDLINFREQFVKTIQSDEDLYIVLCQEHCSDIMLYDQAFRDRFNNTESGKLINSIQGFKAFQNLNNPIFNNTTYVKKAIGAAAAGTDTVASVAYTTKNAMRCTGSVSVYYQDASIDPINRQSLFGAAVYNLVSPVTAKGIGAIISDAA